MHTNTIRNPNEVDRERQEFTLFSNRPMTNIHTNIVAKFNLRTLHEMAKSRLSPRAQGEYREVFTLMVDEVVKKHPWAKPFLTPKEWAAPSMYKALNK